MDEPDNNAATKPIAVLVGVALLAFAAQQAFGDDGLAVVLVLALGALALVGLHRLTGRSFAGLPAARPADLYVPSAPAQEDTWRSERWVREAVERGLRAIDEWRQEQQAT
jgi:hypothetical protein